MNMEKVRNETRKMTQSGTRGRGNSGGSDKDNPKKEQSNQAKPMANLVWKENIQNKRTGGALIGKLVTERSLNRNVSCQMIRKGWNLERSVDLEITEVERNTLMFEFRRKEDHQRVLRGRPWSIQGILLNIQPWGEFATYKEIDFHLCPFWIQFHDLPTGAMYEENVLALGNMIGEVVMVKNPRRNNLLIRSYLRARVIVDIRKPLITGMWSPRPSREPIWINARYERLQNFCYGCGRIGHDQKTCPDEEDEETEGSRKFGGWLSIHAAHLIEGIIRRCKIGWEEDTGECKSRNNAEEDMRKEQNGISETSKGLEGEEGVMKGKVVEGKKDEKEKEITEEAKETENLRTEESGEGAKTREGSESENGEVNKMIPPERKEDLTRALVVYGTQSPITEVLEGIKRMQLKRDREEDEERSASKRRRLINREKEGGMEVSTKIPQRRIKMKYVRGETSGEDRKQKKEGGRERQRGGNFRVTDGLRERGRGLGMSKNKANC